MKIALLMWPDTFEDWYPRFGVDRPAYLEGYDGEWSITVARNLRDAGCDVHIVFATCGDEGAGRQEPSKATVHFVRAAPAYRALRWLAWDRYERHGATWAQRLWPAAPVLSTLSTRLLATVVGLRPDVVVIQDYEPLRFDVAAPLLRLAGRRTARVVGLDTGGSFHPSRAPWKRWTRRAAHSLLVSHEREAIRVRRLGGRDVAVWPVPVRTEVFVPRDRAAARAELGLNPDSRVVVYAGRLHAVKGLDDLADACVGLDCDLVLVGGGDQENRLRARQRSQARLRLEGFCDPPSVARWFAAADVVALASRHEGQPVSVLEALACGRGVVATAVGGVPEVINDGVTGWLVPPADVGSLRDALADALDHRAEADRRGAAGRELVLARHAPAAATAEMMRLLLGGAS